VSSTTPPKCLHPESRRIVQLKFVSPVILGCWLILCRSTLAQSNASAHTPQKPAQVHSSPKQSELQKRIAAAQSARDSGDPAAVDVANRRLIADALRELAQLRLIERAYPQSAELYRRSLEFEGDPNARLDLATADIQSNQSDDAIAESGKVVSLEPSNIRALNLNGTAWAQKGDYSKAVDAFEQAARIKPDIETLYSLATCLLQTKTPPAREKSSRVFERMIRVAGDDGSLHVLFGRAYRDAGDMPAAIREFQRALALDPRTPHANYFLALARLATNEWKPTQEIRVGFQKELELFPHDYLANYMIGFIASGERQYDLSDQYLKKAADVNPDWPEPWLYMGLNAYAQNDFERAEQMFRKTIELTGQDESRSNFQIRRAYVDLGRILVNSGRAKEAETYLAKARALQNKVFEATQRNMAEMVAAGGAGSAAAIVPLSSKGEASLLGGRTDPFERVNSSLIAKSGLSEEQRSAATAQEDRLRSALALGFNDLATSEAVRKDYSAALGHYEDAEHWDANIPGLEKNRGLAAFRSSNYSEAIRGLSQALAKQPTDNPVRAMLGMAYFGANRFDDAAKTFSPLGTHGMRDPAVGYAWAASLVHANDLKAAGRVLSEFEKDERPNDSLLLVGQLWIEIGDYGRAVSTFHRALQSDPSLQQAHYFAGQADIRWEHWTEAADEFQAELQLEPNSADAKYNLGFVYLQQSNIESAVALFQEVVSANPNHANAQYQLGKIMLDRGRLPDAIEHLEAAERLSPQTDYIHYQLQAAYRKQSRIADADRELALYKDLKSKQREVPAAQTGQNH
jgi:tetratricopeptide (TPR) repeat protein